MNPANVGRKVPHGVILKIVATNICGSRPAHGPRPHDRPARAWSSATRSPARSIETGPDVEFIKVGDLVSVPFNIACGRCRNCKEGKTGICLNVNPDRPGAAYGYVDMGGWVGGQAEYVMVPYADWNLLKFPDKEQAMEKILDLTMLSDIFPTGYHGCVTAGVTTGLDRLHRRRRPGRARRRALGAPARRRGRHRRRPDPRAARAGPQLRLRDRRRHQGRARATRSSRSSACPRSTARVDAVGFEARGHGADAGEEAPATVLNSLMDVTRAGGALGIPGLYVTGDPGRRSTRTPRTGRCRSASASAGRSRTRFATGQCPVMRYHRAADAGDPARPGADRQGGQRHA